MYKPEDLVMEYIDDSKSGKDLLKWYKFVSNITYQERSLIGFRHKKNDEKLYDKICEFYMNNFNIDVSEEEIRKNLESQGHIQEADVNIGRIGAVKYHITMLAFTRSSSEPICDNESLKKLLFYDFDFLVRLRNIYGLEIYDILNMVIKHDKCKYPSRHLIYVPRYISTFANLSHNRISEPDFTQSYCPGTRLSTAIYDNIFGTFDNITFLYIMNVTSTIIKDKVTYVFNKYVLPPSLIWLSMSKQTNDVEVIYPKSLRSICLNYVPFNVIYPDYIEELGINIVLYSGKMKLPRNLKSLTCSSLTSFKSLPISLERIKTDYINTDISHLVNLKVLIFGVYTIPELILPSNIEYLDYTHPNSRTKTNLDKIEMNHLTKLKFLIVGDMPKNIPKSVEYISCDAYVFTPNTNVKYISSNLNVNYIPNEVRYVSTPDCIDKPKGSELQVSICNYKSTSIVTYDD